MGSASAGSGPFDRLCVDLLCVDLLWRRCFGDGLGRGLRLRDGLGRTDFWLFSRLGFGCRLGLGDHAAVSVLADGELPLGHLRLAGRETVGDRADDQAARADRVVVAGDDVVGLVGVAVRVDERDDRQTQPARLAYGELLLAEVDDEDCSPAGA